MISLTINPILMLQELLRFMSVFKFERKDGIRKHTYKMSEQKVHTFFFINPPTEVQEWGQRFLIN